MASYTDFAVECVRGNAVTLQVAITRGGTAENLANWASFTLTAGRNKNDQLWTKSVVQGVGSGISVTNPTAGILTCVIPGTTTRAMTNDRRTLYIDISGTDSAGITTALSSGTLAIGPLTGTKPAKWTPKSVSGCTLWLRASQALYQFGQYELNAAGHSVRVFRTPCTVDGDPVGGWKDGGGRSHHFRTFSGMSTSASPVYVTNPITHEQQLQEYKASYYTNVLNGKPAVRADGNCVLWAEPANTRAFISEDAWNVFLVGSAATIPAGSTWADIAPWISFQYAGLGVREGRAVAYSNPPSGSDVFVEAAYTAGTYGLFEARMEAGTLGLRLNGGTETQSACAGTFLGDEGPPATNLLASNTKHLSGDLLEILVYGAAISSADRGAIRNYLATTYALPGLRAVVTGSVSTPSTVVTPVPGADVVDKSGSILEGGEHQTIMEANPFRTYISVTNTSSGRLWLDWGRDAQMGSPSTVMPPGATISGVEMGGVTLEEVTIIGATTGQTFTAAEVTGTSSTTRPPGIRSYSKTTPEDGEAGQALDINENRIYFYLSNDSAQTIWWDLGREAQMGTPSWALAAGQSVEVMGDLAPIDDVTVISAVAGAAYTVKEASGG